MSFVMLTCCNRISSSPIVAKIGSFSRRSLFFVPKISFLWALFNLFGITIFVRIFSATVASSGDDHSLAAAT